MALFNFNLNVFRAVYLAALIIAAVIPTAPRLLRYFRTGQRNTHPCVKPIGQKPSSFPKARRLACLQDSADLSTGDILASERRYTQLHDRPGRLETEMMHMQILKTSRIEVASEESQRAHTVEPSNVVSAV